MKNKRGFTLIELLATITILGILVTIAGVSISKVLNRGKNDANSIQKELIEGAAKQYAIDECSDTCEITINELIQNGYLDEDKAGNIDKTKTLYMYLNKKNVSVTHSNKLTDIILGENNSNVISDSPKFTSPYTDVGLYVQKGDSTRSNNGLPTYYYRGSVTNNYVSFGTYKKDVRGYKYFKNNNSIGCCYVFAKKAEPALWRIVRINEDGSIRLISEVVANSTADNYGYVFDADTTSVYPGSDIETTLNTWFNNTLDITDNSLLLTRNFCNDTSNNASTRISNKTPSYVCPDGGNLITAKVGGISVDEVMYAGGLKGTKLSYNTTYLDNDFNYWYTITPSSATSVYLWTPISLYFTTVNTATTIKYYYIRPVINISSDAIVIEGNGSKISPYVIR